MDIDWSEWCCGDPNVGGCAHPTDTEPGAGILGHPDGGKCEVVGCECLAPVPHRPDCIHLARP